MKQPRVISDFLSLTDDMRPEAAYLVSVLRGDPSRLGADSTALDDVELLRLARMHQVEALCYWHESQESTPAPLGGGAELSETVRDAFRSAYLTNLLRNRPLVRDLEKISAAFGQRGVAFLVFKGPWLAWAAYPDLGTRPVGDIDLCIHEGDYEGAVTALRSIGYRPTRSLPATPAAALRHAHFVEQIRFTALRRLPVELHFRLVNIGPPTRDEEWVWRRTGVLKVGRLQLPVPGPEAMVLHLLLHANQHAFSRLRYSCDIRYALERFGTHLDLAALTDRVRNLRCAASAYFGFLIAGELAGARVSPHFLEGLRPHALRRAWFRAAWRVAPVCRLEAPPRYPRLEAPLLYLLEIGTLKDKALYLTGIIQRNKGFFALRRGKVKDRDSSGVQRD